MKTVLLIDDDPTMRLVLARYLKQNGWAVLEAPDGETGVHLAKKHLPAAILCDLLMPRANGFQVCSAIRNEATLRHTLLIAMSGRDYAANQLAAQEAGADEFLVKPFDPETLLELLRRLTREETPRPAAASGHRTLSPKGTTIKFWGVRGSIPAPGPDTARYGGNTACVEVRADGEIIILDSGTGIRALGVELNHEFKEQPLDLTILITHTHWDHVQGFPFFRPAYDSRNHIRILGYEGAREGLAGIFSSQMETPYFPVGLGALPGHIVIEEQKEMGFSIGPVKVRAEFTNHPGVCVGYRLYTSGGSVVYMPDNEPFYRARAAAGTPGKAKAADFDRAESQKIIAFMEGADVLIIDAQYDAEEYEAHIGWGHGCVDDVVWLAMRAEVKRVCLFHHDPEHDDAKIDAMVAHARRLVEERGGTLIVEAAREGERIELGTPAVAGRQF